jgi:hypothetical protein
MKTKPNETIINKSEALVYDKYGRELLLFPSRNTMERIIVTSRARRLPMSVGSMKNDNHDNRTRKEEGT